MDSVGKQGFGPGMLRPEAAVPLAPSWDGIHGIVPHIAPGRSTHSRYPTSCVDDVFPDARVRVATAKLAIAIPRDGQWRRDSPSWIHRDGRLTISAGSSPSTPAIRPPHQSTIRQSSDSKSDANCHFVPYIFTDRLPFRRLAAAQPNCQIVIIPAVAPPLSRYRFNEIDVIVIST